MNRATKRLLAKQQAAAEKQPRKRPTAAGIAAAGAGPKDPFFTRMRRFVREVRAELKKVAWPSRSEVVTYTVVVLVAVTFVTLVVFGMDFGFGKLVFKVYGQ